MSSSLRELHIENLTVSQRLDLIALLWDSIPDSAEALPLLDSHRQELERRLAARIVTPKRAFRGSRLKRGCGDSHETIQHRWNIASHAFSSRLGSGHVCR